MQAYFNQIKVHFSCTCTYTCLNSSKVKIMTRAFQLRKLWYTSIVNIKNRQFGTSCLTVVVNLHLISSTVRALTSWSFWTFSFMQDWLYTCDECSFILYSVFQNSYSFQSVLSITRIQYTDLTYVNLYLIPIHGKNTPKVFSRSLHNLSYTVGYTPEPDWSCKYENETATQPISKLIIYTKLVCIE